KLNKQTFNLEEAKKLLAQEGFKDTNGDGVIEKDGKPFELTLQIFKKTAIPEALQAQLAKAGIKINIRQMDDTQKNLEEGKFDMSLNSYITAVTGDGQRILEQNFSTKGADNYGKYSNPEYDAVIAKLAGEFDAAKRVELETEAQKILLQDTPDLFLVSSKTIIVTKNSVKNLKKYPLDYYLISKDTTM
ncbi:MAG: ABC transporter substrate-binding protein, partial [Acidaminococcaceae bacterium]|nr:ABC transporter substrate-binding protein [Acidaminococcaceae bacterium]